VIRLRNPPSSPARSIAKEALRKTLGENARQERTARRINQNELTARSELDPGTIAKIKVGELRSWSDRLNGIIQRAISYTLKSRAIETPTLKGKEGRQ
jgi:hypothetical protein